MAEHTILAAYVLGRLDEVERARVARRLAAEPELAREERELREVVGLVRAGAPAVPPADLEQRTLAAVAHAAGAGEDVGRARRRHDRRVPVLAALAGAGAVCAVALGFAIGRTGDQVTTSRIVLAPPTRPPGPTEVDTRLVGTGARAAAVVTKVGAGRLVHVTSRSVPILPTGVRYELWFVAPGDRPGRPRRISAGTWHPDERGLTDVTFLIAADPAKFPRIEVTRERDTDPAATLPDVLHSPS